MTTRRGIANKLDRVGALLASVTAELREPEPPRLGATRSTQELIETIEELVDQITRLEKASKQPDRRAYTPREVAAMTGINYHRVIKMIHEGQLGAVKPGTASYVIPAAELDRFLSQGILLEQVPRTK